VPNPSDPQALSRYTYVRNNPVMMIDPTGHVYDRWADCDHTITDDKGQATTTYLNPNGGNFNQADCWKYNQERQILLAGGVSENVLSEARQDTEGLLLTLTSVFGIWMHPDIGASFSWKEARAATIAFAQIARTLARALGGNDDWVVDHATQVFSAVFGGSEVYKEPGMNVPGNADASAFVLGRVMFLFSKDAADPDLYIHEFGHIFDNIITGKVFNDDNTITGPFINAGIKQGYFAKSSSSEGYLKRYGQSTYYYSEQAADMFYAFVTGNFDSRTPAGQYRWITMMNNMPKWVGKFYTYP